MSVRKWTGALVFLLLPAAATIGAEGDASEDPRATHAEASVIGGTAETKFGRLSTLALTIDGRLLACDSERSEVRVIGRDGETSATWKLPFRPTAICPAEDGTVYVGGPGVVAKLDKTGKLLKKVAHQEGEFPRSKASGMAATERDLFVSFGSGWSLRSRAVIVRFDRDLGAAKTIAKDLRGCCQRLDLAARDGVLYVAENTRYRVVKCDREGKVLGRWGRRDRKDVSGFGACCNPMNLCFSPEGVLYTAESGLGRVKRYRVDGEFLGVVGYAGVPRFTRAGHQAASCSNIALAVSADGKTVYVQDVKKNLIRVLKQRPPKLTEDEKKKE